MRSFFPPPPPASSLTRFDRYCYNHLSCHHLTSHHLTSLLLVLCLALGLVACQSGGSSASSANNDENISVNDGSDSSDINGDETPTLVDNADISIADLSDSSKSIISMREFLLTVTYNNLNTQRELNFIVGESTTPPTWNSVKANPTKITRAFNNGNLKTRRIYFSATEKLTDVSFDVDGNATITGKVIDLSQDGQTEAQITKAQAPGIMAPNTSYYVYVYDSRGALVKQQKVTTAGYPGQSEFATAPIDPTQSTSNPPSPPAFSSEDYHWGTSIWSRVLFNPISDSDAEKNKLGVEMRRGEVVFYPMRRRPSFDWDQDFTATEKASGATYNCNPASYQHKLEIRERIFGSALIEVVTITKDGVEKTGDGLVFFKSPSLLSRLSSINPAERNRVFDIMYLVRPNGDYDNFEFCKDSLDFFDQLSQERNYKPVSLVSE